jgi:hypothetical protein
MRSKIPGPQFLVDKNKAKSVRMENKQLGKEAESNPNCKDRFFSIRRQCKI